MAAGLAAMYIIGEKLWQLYHSTAPQTWADAFVWGTTFLAAVLLVWREKNQTQANKRAAQEHSRLIAAAETSTEGFSIFDPVRNALGDIVDFRLSYVNAHAEKILKKPRQELLGKQMCALFPEFRTGGLFDRYLKVVLTGEPLQEEFSITRDDGSEIWLRHRVVKLGDGVTTTASDISEVKAGEERYRQLSNFSNSVFDTAPFSIIETDSVGIIQAMNAAAEKLTGYQRHELIGKASIIDLHDRTELKRRCEELQMEGLLAPDVPPSDDFVVLVAKVSRGEAEEREWTYVRRDGTTAPVLLALTPVQTTNDEISGYVAIASDLTERKQMTSYLSHLASHDQLTGLAGRTLLRERIAEAIERAALHGRHVGVFVVDMDAFKRMNDSLGHRSGDEVLVGMAARLGQAVRKSDTIGRLGGDEFVVVMPHIASLPDVDRCAKRLVDIISSTAMVGDLEVNMTASVGVCIYPDFASDVDSLLERADAAMYAAKENGRNQYQIFTEAMLEQSQNRHSMEGALRHALARKEMFLHYQPIVSLTTGRVTGMEALLRWRHPKMGMVPPSNFIPLAEETGMIVAIGEWTFKRACIEAKSLSEELGRDLHISINLSPKQFEQNNLLQVIEDAISDSKISPRNLQVELTENTLMINSASNLGKLQHIRDLGARVAIDDFGTGFCSFSYLLEYPVDRLKIDQSFVMKSVTDPNAATVVRTIMAMSHNLGVKVVAEGIETVEHLKFLVRRKCDEAQGYYFSRPVPASAFAEAVANIERMFDETKVLQEAEASPETTGAGHEFDRELEASAPEPRHSRKHVLM
jgi:diguanylate cyclase (GGDEF)-like protein